jgi:hypothetical protein
VCRNIYEKKVREVEEKEAAKIDPSREEEILSIPLLPRSDPGSVWNEQDRKQGT